MGGMIDVLRRRRLSVHQPQVGQQRRQQHEERHDGGDARVLQLADVPLVELLQLVVLEAMGVEEAGEHPGGRHCFHAVVHRGGSGYRFSGLFVLLFASAGHY